MTGQSLLKKMGTPVFWAEGHPGPLRREDWTLDIAGMVRRPLTLTWEEILKLPKTVEYARLTSVTRWSVGGRWGGVRLAEICELAALRPGAAFARFHSYRGIYTTSIPLEIARKERSLLAYEFEGEPLDADYGGPIRALIPYLWGYKSAKSVVMVEFLRESVPGYWEVRGYSDTAEIEAGEVLDVNTGKRRLIPAGEVVKFWKS